MDSPIENLINKKTDNYNKGCRNVFVGQPLNFFGISILVLLCHYEEDLSPTW